MLPEEEMAFNESQAHVHQSLSQAGNAQVQQQVYIDEQEKTLAEAQLDCEQTKTKIFHLLKQDVLRPNKENGMLEWHSLPDKKQLVLTDLGVDRIMQVVESYINKETLLSNFDAKQIDRRMLKFCHALNANMFMKYELYFRTPTLSECKEIIMSRLNERRELKNFAAEMLGQIPDKKIIEDETLREVENRIEKEITKVRQEKMKQNLREYEMLFTQIEALVEATHNRAFRGEERGSIRRHMNVSEVIGGGIKMPQKQGGIPKWFGG